MTATAILADPRFFIKVRIPGLNWEVLVVLGLKDALRLLIPPGTPLFPSLEMDSQKTLANPQPESAARGNLALNQPALSPGLSSTGTRRPSSSGGPGSRPATPTRRPTLTASKPARSSTPTSRATLQSPSISASKPVTSAAKLVTKPLTSSTKPTVSAVKSLSPATKLTVSARSSTPTRSTVRSSTPTARPIPSSKPSSRATTPTRRPSTPSSTNISASPAKASSSVTKPTPTASRNFVPSRGAPPMVASRPWKTSEMPGFLLDTPPNLRTTTTIKHVFSGVF
ncbi:leucine-rich repeat extensin-like protein 5 [Hibiscus syriacus]|uniref:leucine-rich repeat extensin-like protein 5 n=1 Tax=Hibiscus syriacus TaxID=106335 RepID=UPI001920D05C|nr:leucine-rich repeat extensin-like protein 5 [Hibiscus syriacus]